MIGIMSGYGIKIRALRWGDLEYQPELQEKISPPFDNKSKFPIDYCIAVLGEDLAEGIAAVVYLFPGKHELVWYDKHVIDGRKMVDIPYPDEFISAVIQVVHAVHPNVI